MPKKLLSGVGSGPQHMPPLPLVPAPLPPLPLAPPPLPPLPAPPLQDRDLMPPLPPIPLAGWQPKAPAAHVVQQAYVDRRLDELADIADQDVRLTLQVLRADLMARMPEGQRRPLSKKKLKAVYAHIERNLQAADLTINFKATSWFSRANEYETYTQMYERARRADGTMVMKEDDPANPVRTRVAADNRVTFPAAWRDAGPGARRGLSPAGPAPASIQARMHTGNMEFSDADQGYLARNPRFDPRTKQIFTALNYGRRPHGSAITYGFSHMVLRPAVKARALYYPTDTFDVSGAKLGTSVQVPYGRLGTIYGKSSVNNYSKGGKFRRFLLEACYDGKVLPDSGWSEALLEAHLFGELSFREHVSHMVLSRRDFTLAQEGAEWDNAPFTLEWATIVENARRFAVRVGIRLFQAD